MTVTLNLSPESEAWLRQKAALQGYEMSAVVTQIVLETLEREAKDTSETIAGVQRGLDDFEHGRSRALSDFAAEQQARHGLPTITYGEIQADR